MLRRLQWCHLVCLALVPIFYALFRLASEDHDADRQLVDNLMTLAIAAVTAFSIVFMAITGKKDDAVPSLIRTYRAQLTKPVFLWVTDAVLVSVVILLGGKLVLYRSVEFVSPRTGEIILNDAEGDQSIVGVLEKEHPARFRLPIGNHAVLFRELGTNKALDAKVITVTAVMTHPSRVRVTLGEQKEADYGVAK